VAKQDRAAEATGGEAHAGQQIHDPEVDILDGAHVAHEHSRGLTLEQVARTFAERDRVGERHGRRDRQAWWITAC